VVKSVASLGFCYGGGRVSKVDSNRSEGGGMAQYPSPLKDALGLNGFFLDNFCLRRIVVAMCRKHDH